MRVNDFHHGYDRHHHRGHHCHHHRHHHCHKFQGMGGGMDLSQLSPDLLGQMPGAFGSSALAIAGDPSLAMVGGLGNSFASVATPAVTLAPVGSTAVANGSSAVAIANSGNNSGNTIINKNITKNVVRPGGAGFRGGLAHPAHGRR